VKLKIKKRYLKPSDRIIVRRPTSKLRLIIMLSLAALILLPFLAFVAKAQEKIEKVQIINLREAGVDVSEQVARDLMGVIDNAANKAEPSNSLGAFVVFNTSTVLQPARSITFHMTKQLGMGDFMGFRIKLGSGKVAEYNFYQVNGAFGPGAIFSIHEGPFSAIWPSGATTFQAFAVTTDKKVYISSVEINLFMGETQQIPMITAGQQDGAALILKGNFDPRLPATVFLHWLQIPDSAVKVVDSTTITIRLDASASTYGLMGGEQRVTVEQGGRSHSRTYLHVQLYQ
jgi:hypothetical protein